MSGGIPDTTVPEASDSILGRQLWRLWPHLRPYRWHAIGGIVTNALARVFDFLPLLIIGALVDDAAGGQRDPMHYVWAGVLVLGTFIGLAIFQSVSDYLWSRVAQYVRHDIRVRLYDHLQREDVTYLEDRQTGDLMAVVSGDVDNLENFLADATTSIVRLVVTFVGTFVILFWMHWQLALLLLGPMPLAILAVRFFATRVQPRYRAARQAVGRINSILENNIQGMPVIQAYTATKEQAKRVDEQSIAYRDEATHAAFERARFVPMLYGLAGVAFAAVIAVGGYLTTTPTGPSIGDFVAFVLLATRLIMPLFIFGMLLNQIQRSEASARRIFEVLDHEPTITDAPGAKPLTGVPASLALDGVHFSYPGREEPVLSGIQLEAAQGQLIGVVGHTGAGKSTILKLLLGYYRPKHGSIRVDGHDLRGVTLESLRQHIGYVSQEPYLFTGTVRDNINLGSPDASDEAIQEAARVAGAHEFITALPEGYETLVGERGVKLSGGQRQRISLARAILRDPAILVLDEATSAMDSQTEKLIQDNLNDHRSDRITIAVAHRLSTIRHADQIHVLVDGCQVEGGTHDELVAAGGVYADLWRVQSGNRDDVAQAAIAA